MLCKAPSVEIDYTVTCPHHHSEVQIIIDPNTPESPVGIPRTGLLGRLFKLE